MWKLGDYEINGRVILAPMAGFTSFGYRKLFEQFDVDIAYTEMISDMGLIYGNKETSDYLPSVANKFLVGVQLFGSDPENILKAAKIAKSIAKQMDFIDINMACPVPKVVKTGAGSSLLKDPKKCGEIIRLLKENFSIPITAKIRMGWSEKYFNFLEVINELEKAGVDMIALHARTREDYYNGLPRYETLRGLRSKMKVPLAISGNIFTLDDAKNALEITGADAVMIARGGIGNPLLAKQINTYYKRGIILPDASLNEDVEYCLRLARFLVQEKGEDKAMRMYRAIAPKFFHNRPNVKALKVKLSTGLKTYQDLVDIITEYLKENNFYDEIEKWNLWDKDFNMYKNKIIYRGEMIPVGYYHLVLDIIVEHQDGSFLIMQRDYRKHHGGMFELTCGGSAYYNESPLEAAERELKEETGIENVTLMELGRERDDSKGAIYVEYHVLCDIDKNSIVLQEGETIDYKWVSLDELKKMINSKEISNKRILKYMPKIVNK